MLDWYTIILVILVIVLLVARNNTLSDYIKSAKSGTTLECLSSAYENVTYIHPFDNTIWKPLLLIDNGDTFTMYMESTSGPRIERHFKNLTDEDLKHSAKHTSGTGEIRYRITKEYILRTEDTEPKKCNNTSSERNTNDELDRQSAFAFKTKSQLMGEISERDANTEEQKDKEVERLIRISSNKLPPGAK